MDRLAGLLEYSPDPLLVADGGGTIIHATDGAGAIFGRDPDALAGSDLAGLFSMPGRDDVDGLFDPDGERRRLGAETPVFAERADGGSTPVDLTVVAATVDGDARILASLTEATAPDDHSSEARYRRLLEHSPAPIVIYDTDATVVYANEAAATLHGVGDPATLEGTPALEHIHPEDRQASRAGVDRVIVDGEPVESVERRLQTADGGTRHVVLSAVPTTYEDEPAGQVFFTDVTELKERERDLERQNDRLDRFASIVSHDLRNPLTVLQSSLELTEADDEHIARAERAVDRMDQLLEGLLTIARQGRAPEETAPVALADVAWAAWQQVDTGDASLDVEADGTVEAAESRLQELLENLISNAVTHGDDGVTVTVGATADGFSVADDGPGIPPEDRETVFENGYTTATGGTGLGLAIVAEIADVHDWDVTLTESQAGGARFEFDCA